MQMMSPSSPRTQRSACSLNHEHAHAHSPSRVSFEVLRVPHNPLIPELRSSATLTAATNVLSMPNPHLRVVDLTESPIPSPCSSDPSLSPTSFSSSMSLTVPSPKGSRPKSLGHPPQSSPVFSPHPVALTATGSPRRPPKFILSSDVDDRDQGSAHDDSDDSDRTSFFSAEELLVPGSALPSPAGKAVYSQGIQQSDGHNHAWDPLGPEPLLDALKHHAATFVNEERDAAHALRRWHVLMEILHTEEGYVRDLRVLVKVSVILF